MAESQLACMDDGRMGAPVPETKPEFYYSEVQRVAIEELLRNGDSAFKTRLKEDNMKDFLSAREVKRLQDSFNKYDTHEDSGESDGVKKQNGSDHHGDDDDSGLHSTYWPQLSDTEVPNLDIGWTSGGMFKGVTRVAVHTHPPKDGQGPHIKEVVRRLIQEASKVIAIVMDMLTDVHILQDLMDAACRRSVPVYILLDDRGVPHFLDMCSRLQIGSQHLRNMRARSLQGVGMALCFGRVPGLLCNKYMLVDGDKVMYGSYSFSWCTARMDRNMITVMTGSVVDFFDQDFRELYAVSQKMDLYKEFHVSPPAPKKMAPKIHPKMSSKRPPLPAMTSRFQVALGETRNSEIKVPAHKYHNPLYSLVFGEGATGSLQEPKRELPMAVTEDTQGPARPRLASSERLDRPTSPLPGEPPMEVFSKPNGLTRDKKGRFTWKIFTKGKSFKKLSINNLAESTSPKPPSTEINQSEKTGEEVEMGVKSPSKWPSKKPPKLGKKADSVQAVDTKQDDNESVNSRTKSKQGCKMS